MYYLRKIGREGMDWIKVTQDRIKLGVFVNKVAYIRIRLPEETITLKGNYTLESSGALCNLLPNYISTAASHLHSACLSYKKTTPTHRLTCYQKEVIWSVCVIYMRHLQSQSGSSRWSVSCSFTIHKPQALPTKVTTVVYTLYDTDRKENLNFVNWWTFMGCMLEK